MNYSKLCQKKDRLIEMKKRLPKEVIDSFEKSFEVEFIHNSIAIEGNTLTLDQVKAILEVCEAGGDLSSLAEIINGLEE